MKLTTIALNLLATSTLCSAANFCRRNQSKAGWNMIAGYSIRTEGQVPDIGSICGGLWDNLKHFHDCIGVSQPSCRDEGGHLVWVFVNGGGCNTGMVESAWYEATKNQWGPINCEQHWT